MSPLRPDRRFFDRAIAMLEDQPTVPMSPGCVENGRTLLCAGAAVIAAAIEITHSQREREAFERAIVAAGGSRLFYRAIDALGWRRWLVAGAIRPNDACAEAERKSRMIARLNELTDEVCGESRTMRAA